jgi:hypothetical protein
MNVATITRDLPSRRFQPLLFGLGAWTDHLHFGYDLVAELRPKLLVELGTDRGESYFGFCQSAVENDTGTRCFAIDSWRGDDHAGNYDEVTFEQVAAHNREHYESFSTLLRSTFDEAADQFDDHAIDLLHLDGLHTEEAVRHDLDQWLPKLKAGGVLLMHDVMVRNRGFGVWKVWDEIRAREKSFTFERGPGLGVWQKPPASELPPFVEALFTAPNEYSSDLIDYYNARADELQKRVAEQWRDGSIRQSAFARQTIIQVFYTRDGQYRPEDSAEARIGHDSWKTVSIPLPAGCCERELRVDFVSAFTTIDIAKMALTANDGRVLSQTKSGGVLGDVTVRGDAERIEHHEYLRLKITGIDPQLYLPLARDIPAELPLSLRIRLRVKAPPGFD